MDLQNLKINRLNIYVVKNYFYKKKLKFLWGQTKSFQLNHYKV